MKRLDTSKLLRPRRTDFFLTRYNPQLGFAILPRIQSSFKRWGSDFDELLGGLAALDGIGLTIASGLIWSIYPDEAVPFDKYTTTYALHLGLINSHRISGSHYHRACASVLAYCEEYEIPTENRAYDVEDFVREAWVEAHKLEWSIQPA